MKVRDLMTRNVESCSPDSDLAAAAMMMWRNDCGAIPVTNDGVVVGVITDRDICMAVTTRHRLAEDIRVRDVISGNLHAVRSSDDIEVALKRMRSERVRRLPVVNGDGRIAGIVSVNDLILNADASKNSPLSADQVLTVMKAVCEHTNARETSTAGA